MTDQINNTIVIEPSDFFKASTQLGWDSIIGCKIIHRVFGPGIIQSFDQFVQIHFLEDPDNRDFRRFMYYIFWDGNTYDLEVPFELSQPIEKTLGRHIVKIDPRIAGVRREMLKRIEKFDFEGAEEIFAEIKEQLEEEDVNKYQSLKGDYKEKYRQECQKKLLQETLDEIDAALKKFQFTKANHLYEKIAELYPNAEFEQRVLEARIPYELRQHNFLEADQLFAQSTTITSKSYFLQKAEAIQRYFEQWPDAQVTEEQAFSLADNSRAMLIKARAGSGKTRVLACKTALLINKYQV